jgi:DNA-binding MarR family transcriptional regulator
MARPDLPPVEAPPPAGDPLAFQLLNEVGILSQLSANRAARLLAPGLNLSQFSLLNHFSRLGGERSLVQLASAMQVTKAAMTNTVTRLQAKGLLAVQPDPQDGRGKLVSLTPAGLAARQQAVRQLGQGLAEMASAISTQDLADALAALRKLRVWFDANR